MTAEAPEFAILFFVEKIELNPVKERQAQKNRSAVNAQDPQSSARFVTLAYQKHGRAVQRYLRRRLRNNQDARELAQEVWTRLLRIKDSGVVLEPLAYFYRAASNVVAEFYMRQQNEPVSFDSDACEEAAEHPSELSPDEVLEQISRQAQFERVMAELPKVYRTIVLLKLRDNLSYEEIGKQLGLATRTAEQYFYRALTKVRNKHERETPGRAP